MNYNLKVLRFSETHVQIIFKNSKDSKYVLIFSLAIAFFKHLAISRFFSKLKLPNIMGTHAATCHQKMAADYPNLTRRC